MDAEQVAVLNSERASAILCNLATGDFELVALPMDSTHDSAALTARGLGWEGAITLANGQIVLRSQRTVASLSS